MAYGAVESAIQGAADRFAKIKQDSKVTTGTDFWARADAAGDETYENRVKGSSLTAVDTAFTNMDLGHNTSFQPWLSLHFTYLNSDLGYTGWDAWLTAMKWRVHQDFAEFYYEWAGARLTATNVFPRETLDYGNYDYDTDLFTADSTTPSTTGRGGIRAVVVTKGGSSLTLSVVANLDDASTSTQRTMNVTIAGGAAVGTAYSVGDQALTSNVSAGGTEAWMASTTQFAANRQVLIYDDNAQEVLTVSGVLGGSLKFSTALRHSYTTAASAKVRPLFDGIQSVSKVSGGDASDSIDFFVNPDRTPAL